MNDGQEISAVPPAGVPSARYTVSMIVVSAGPAPRIIAELITAASNIAVIFGNADQRFSVVILNEAKDLCISLSPHARNRRRPRPIKKPLPRAAPLPHLLPPDLRCQLTC
jgi:hypothetical protein